uniref:Major facilitator superfamily domain containing 4A n=1 Tax=Zonotrichia albicollis TaxID=44394 RepID=A0A8D2MNK9_ZONAL
LGCEINLQELERRSIFQSPCRRRWQCPGVGDTGLWSISLLSPGNLGLQELRSMRWGAAWLLDYIFFLPRNGGFERLAQSLLALFASSLAISLVFAIIPLCHNVVVLAVVMAVAGLAMGCIDTISNMQLVKIYQKDSAIFLQVREGTGGTGAVSNALVPPCATTLGWWHLQGHHCVINPWLEAGIFTRGLAATQPQGDALLTFALHCSPAGHEDLFSCCQSKNFRGVSFTYFAVHITGALVLFMTDGIVGEYSGFVYSYAVEEPLAVVHKVAGYLPSLFWGFITLGRLISIPVSYRMKPATMVFINVVGVLVTFLLLLLFWSSVVFLFVGTASLGLFLSSAFPSLLAYTEDILQYQGQLTCSGFTFPGVWDDLWVLGLHLLRPAGVFPQDVPQALPR